jgi:hypothetical protein
VDPRETIEPRRVPADEEAEMTTRPRAQGLPPKLVGGHAGRTTGNVAVPDMDHCPREATCRRDPAFI